MLNMQHKSLRFCANKMRIKLWKWIRQFESFHSPHVLIHSQSIHFSIVYSSNILVKWVSSSMDNNAWIGKRHFSHPKNFICRAQKHWDVVEPKMIRTNNNKSIVPCFVVTSAFCQRQRNQMRLNSFVRALLISTMPSVDYLHAICRHCVRRFNRLALHSLLHKVYSLSFRIVLCSEPEAHLLITILLCGSYFRCRYMYSIWMGLSGCRYLLSHNSYECSSLSLSLSRAESTANWFNSNRHVFLARATSKVFSYGTCLLVRFTIITYELQLTFLCPRWSYFRRCCQNRIFHQRLNTIKTEKVLFASALMHQIYLKFLHSS